MARARRARRRLPLYVIPILLGVSGIFLSRQLSNMLAQSVMLLFLVAVPFFFCGHLLARFHGSRRERLFLVIGVVLLAIGAAVTVSGLSDQLMAQQEIPEAIGQLSRVLGFVSLLAGLLATLLSVARTGEAIQEIAGRFEHLAHQMSEGFIITDLRGTVAFANRRFLELTGLQDEDILGQNGVVVARALGIDHSVMWAPDKNQGTNLGGEVSLSVGGEERYLSVNVNPILDQRGQLAGSLTTLRDVTFQRRLSKRLERYAADLEELVEHRTRKLQDSEERLRQLLVNMNEGFLTLDAAHRVRFVNDRMCDMLLIPREQLLKRCVFELIAADDQATLRDLLDGAEPIRNTLMRQELAFQRLDGVTVDVVVAVAPVREEEEEKARYSLVITDVTELKQMHYQLEARAAELEAVNEELRAHGRAKDSFLSNVSHELRTPLSTINGYLEMLKSGGLGQVEASQRNALDVMERNANRLMTLIDEMIEVSRMEIRGVRVQPRLFEVGPLVQESVSSAQPQILAKDLNISVHVRVDWRRCGETARESGRYWAFYCRTRRSSRSMKAPFGSLPLNEKTIRWHSS